MRYSNSYAGSETDFIYSVVNCVKKNEMYTMHPYVPLPTGKSQTGCYNPLTGLILTRMYCMFQSQPPAPNMMKPGPSMIQSLPPPTTFNVPAQGPPPSLLQAQLSAASLAPLLQNPPQPLLPQPPPKGRVS